MSKPGIAACCVTALLAGCALGAYAQISNPADEWASWRFLIGDWIGGGAGSPGEGTGQFSFHPDLDGKILVRKSRTEYPPKQGESAGLVHNDLLIVYRVAAQSKFRAAYFDNEGHVIEYGIALPADKNSVTFESDGSKQDTRFRLGYRLGAGDELHIEFSIAPPGMDFKTYLEGSARRRN